MNMALNLVVFLLRFAEEAISFDKKNWENIREPRNVDFHRVDTYQESRESNHLRQTSVVFFSVLQVEKSAVSDKALE